MRRLLLIGVSAVATTLALAGSGASSALPQRQAERPASARTIALTRHRIDSLIADGNFLTWITYPRGYSVPVVSFFDRSTGSVSRLGINLPKFCGEWSWFLSAFAGRRALFGCDFVSLDWYGDDPATATTGRGVRREGEFAIPKDEPVRAGVGFEAASDGHTIVYFAAGQRSEDCTTSQAGCWRQGVWRLVGDRPVLVPKERGLLADLAVAGTRLATLAWSSPCVCDASPAWSPDGREIAWDHDGTVWAMKSDGSNQRRLSTAGADPFVGNFARSDSVRWSPSGATLAFEGKDASIWLVERDGTNQRRLVAGNSPAWSPDGTKLAFIAEGDLWTIDADGSGEKRLTSGLFGWGPPDWSPDGRSLVVDGAGDVYVVDVATGAERRIACCRQEFSQPVWSPDGSRVAMGSESGGSPPGGIWVVRADAGTPERLTSGDTLDRGEYPVWSPDGNRVAYQRQPATIGGPWTTETWVVNADGTDDRKLRSNGCPGPPAWSPDGTRLAAGEEPIDWPVDCGQPGVSVVDPSGGSTKLLAAPWNPPAVEVRDLRTGALLRRWQLPVRNTTGNSISFTGRYLVLFENRGTPARPNLVMHRFDVATGKALGTSHVPPLGPLSASGRYAVYGIGKRIVLIDLKSGRQRTLARPEPYATYPVIENGRVYWAEPYRKGSRVREIDLIPNGTVNAAP